MKELPLVLFTVLAQASAGTFILMMIVNWLGKLEQKPRQILSVTAVVMVIVAGVCAIFHLGHPFRAINALFGTGRSPMSNEIVICAIYGGLAFIFAATHYLTAIPKALQSISGVAASLAAVALVAGIPLVYQLDTIAAWDTPLTYIQMVLTAIVCGATIVTAATDNRATCALSVVASLVMIALLPSYFSHLQQAGSLLTPFDQTIWGLKYGLLVLGAILLTIYTSRATLMHNRNLAIIAAILVVIAELAGRIGFYDLWAIGM